MIDLPFVEECEPGFECWVGICVCKTGHCLKDGRCMRKTCYTGATPKAFELQVEGHRLAAFGLPAPNGGSKWAWTGYAMFLSSLVPLALIGLSVAISSTIGKILVEPPDMWLCRRRARIPVGLPIWAILTLYFCCTGFWNAQNAVAHVKSGMHSDVSSLGLYVDEVVELGQTLRQEGRDFNDYMQAIPATCAMKNLTYEPMKDLLYKVQNTTETIWMEVERMNTLLNILPAELARAAFFTELLGTWLVLVPIGPMLMVLIAALASIVLGWKAFYTSKPTFVEQTLQHLQSRGPFWTKVVLISCTIWAASDLHVGITASRYCQHVDSNTLAVIRSTNLPLNDEAVAFGTREDFISSAEFYIEGLGYNPVENFVSSIQDGVMTLLEVRNATLWVQRLVSTMCPGITNFNVHKVQGLTLNSTQRMRTLLHPRSVYPIYTSLVHDTFCTSIPRNMEQCVLFSLLTAFVMLPLLIMTFYVDLKRMWEAKRSPEPEEEDETESEEYLFDPTKPMMSSATYSHATPTNIPKGSTHHHEQRTFMA